MLLACIFHVSTKTISQPFFADKLYSAFCYTIQELLSAEIARQTAIELKYDLEPQCSNIIRLQSGYDDFAELYLKYGSNLFGASESTDRYGDHPSSMV